MLGEWLLYAILSHCLSFTSNTFSISAIKWEPEATPPPQMQVLLYKSSKFSQPKDKKNQIHDQK